MSNALTFNFTPDSDNDSKSKFDFDTSFDTSFLDADASNDFIYIITDDQPKQQVTVRFALEATVSELDKVVAAINSKDINLAKTIVNDLLSGAKDLLESMGDDE